MTGTEAAFAHPAPVTDADSEPFWSACVQGELVGQRCGGCGTWRWPPREYCPECHTPAPVWERLPGTGRIVGHVVVHRPLGPAFADELPLAIVHVELDGTEGEMVLTSKLQEGEWRHAAVGARVSVRFTAVRPGLVLPAFTLDHESTPAPAPAPAQKEPRHDLDAA
ncbi:Zn-ribbon domain-containing OB-fold protein [Streptomyces sp. NPDC057474]|uniref:Zn-ribbon domain-containing OB-fold protein n=1 Tax=Streptomyces sp. NPDC057474 TaxID=3346144 RepID=UPI0036A6175F